MAAVAEIAIREEFGWRTLLRGALTIWVKGYGEAPSCEAVAKAFSATAPSVADLDAFLNGLDGFFAIAAAGPDWTFAAVDWVRSIPVAWGRMSGGWLIDDQADRLRQRMGLGPDDVDGEAALALGMAGYTIDVSTLYSGVNQLGPGECVLFRPGGEPQRHRYYTYRPWRADKPVYDDIKAEGKLSEVTLDLVDTMMRGIGDRLLLVPLSAGRDSRLIVSAARRLGYRNVCTFAYGKPGNHEATTSKAIADRLGYPWRFVPTSAAFMRKHYASSDWGDYNRFADTLQSTPFVQDLPQIQTLKSQGYIPDDAVLCNGNSGDYISGLHILLSMRTPPVGHSEEERLAQIATALYDKHFALWQALRTPAAQASITTQLRASLARADAAPGDSEDDYGLYEYAEFQDRQCKYVITGQRIYEYLGHEWRMPLWDKAYLDFFETVPLAGKSRQRLYADMLVNANWGGVWQDVPVNRKIIKPNWVRPLRFLAKVVHAPAGRDAWHRFERRYFQYWMEQGGHSAARSYRQVCRDRRGARSGIAWQTETYLNAKDLDFGGRMIEPDA